MWSTPMCDGYSLLGLKCIREARGSMAKVKITCEIGLPWCVPLYNWKGFDIFWFVTTETVAFFINDPYPVNKWITETKLSSDGQHIGPFSLVKCLFSIKGNYNWVFHASGRTVYNIEKFHVDIYMSTGNKSSLIRVYNFSNVTFETAW